SGRGPSKGGEGRFVVAGGGGLGIGICRPWVGAPACTSRNTACALGLPGLISTAARKAPGNSSCKSSRRFAANSLAKKFDTRQVAARPGEARHETKLHRVVADLEHDGDGRSCGLGRQRSSRTTGGDNYGDLSAN